MSIRSRTMSVRSRGGRVSPSGSFGVDSFLAAESDVRYVPPALLSPQVFESCEIGRHVINPLTATDARMRPARAIGVDMHTLGDRLYPTNATMKVIDP